MLGTSDAWSMSRSSQQTSDPAYYIEDCRILYVIASSDIFSPYCIPHINQETAVTNRPVLHCICSALCSTILPNANKNFTH